MIRFQSEFSYNDLFLYIYIFAAVSGLPLDVTELPQKGGGILHTSSLAPCHLVSLSQRRAPRSDVSCQTNQSECCVAVELTPQTYTHLSKPMGENRHWAGPR